MPTIKIKGSSTAAAEPLTLAERELAVNVTDKKLYVGDGAAVRKIVGSLGNQEASAVAITGGSIAGITDLAVADGGTGASTAADARTNLSVPSTTGSGASGTWGIDISGNAATATSATSATTATNLAGGAANRVPYQSASGTTTFVAAPTVTNSYLKWNGTALGWDTVSGGGGGSGDVVGPASATDNQIVLFDGTTGDFIKAATTTGLLKASTGVIAAAVSGTDYAPATSGSANQLLASNGTGGFTNLTTGTGVVTALGVNTGSSGAFVVNGGALGTPLSGTVTNLTGTASININGTVGATTANTGAFTTLSATGNVTLSGGTANGVLYLNGSRVATSGSALTFDGTNLGVGFTANSRGGVVMTTTNNSGTSEQGGYQVTNGNSTGLFAGVNGASYSTGGIGNANNAVLYSIGNADLVFGRNTSEAMRLTSTGLGIGTSSPAAKLDLNASGSNAQMAVQNWPMVRVVGTTLDIGGYNASQWSQTRLYTNGNIAATFDSSGNLGLGVTPSAQGATYRAINLSSSASYFSIAGQGAAACEGNLLWNARTTGSETFAYMHTGDLATRFRQSGEFRWYTAPSGTAGATTSITSGQVYTVTTLGSTTLVQWQAYFSGLSAIPSVGQSITATATGTLAGGATVTQTITFTQAMTLDASGNLGIGTTSISARLNIVGSSSTGYLTVGDGTSTMLMGAGAALSGDSSIPYLRSNNSIGFATGGGNERARITSGGNLLLKDTNDVTVTGPSGAIISALSVGGSFIISVAFSVASPYTQNIQIDITWGNWGSNNVIGLVDLMAQTRQWANTSGAAFGKVFATNTSGAATFSTFNTTNITTSQCTLTAASGGNYTLRLTIDPTNNMDAAGVYLTIPRGISVLPTTVAVSLV